jgi:hypothetical protein
VLVKDSATDYDTSWSSVPVKDAQAFQAYFPATGEANKTASTAYFYPNYGLRTGTSNTRTANRLYVQTVNFGSRVNLDRARIWVTVAATTANKSARLGIYKNDDNMIPVELLADFGTVDISSTGIKAITGIDLDLEAGSYSLVYVLEAGCTMVYALINHQSVGDSFYSTSWGDASSRPFTAFTYAALPDPFPSSTLSPEQNTTPGLFVYIQIGWSLL